VTEPALPAWRRLARSREGLVALLVLLALLDYGAAKGLRALRDGRVGAVPGAGAGAPGSGAGEPLGPGSPVTLTVAATLAVGSRGEGVAVQAGVSVFVAPSLLDQIDLAGQTGATPVDPFGLPDSAGPGLPVADANRGALVAWLDDEPAFPVGSRACIFTPPRSGRLHFGVNDRDPSRNRGSFSVTLSVPEARSVLAATPACGAVLN
jgi:hypothetical protein